MSTEELIKKIQENLSKIRKSDRSELDNNKKKWENLSEEIKESGLSLNDTNSLPKFRTNDKPSPKSAENDNNIMPLPPSREQENMIQNAHKEQEKIASEFKILKKNMLEKNKVINKIKNQVEEIKVTEEKNNNVEVNQQLSDIEKDIDNDLKKIDNDVKNVNDILIEIVKEDEIRPIEYLDDNISKEDRNDTIQDNDKQFNLTEDDFTDNTNEENDNTNKETDNTNENDFKNIPPYNENEITSDINNPLINPTINNEEQQPVNKVTTPTGKELNEIPTAIIKEKPKSVLEQDLNLKTTTKPTTTEKSKYFPNIFNSTRNKNTKTVDFLYKTLIQTAVSLIKKKDDNLKNLIQNAMSLTKKKDDNMKNLIQTAISLVQKKDDNLKNLIQTAISLVQKKDDNLKNLIQTAINLINKTKKNTKNIKNTNNSKSTTVPLPENELNDKIVKYCREQLQVFIENDNKRDINNYTVISTSTGNEDILFIDENPENPSSTDNVLSKMSFECEFKETIPPPETTEPIDPKQPTQQKGEEKTQMYIAKFENGKIVKFVPEDSKEEESPKSIPIDN